VGFSYDTVNRRSTLTLSNGVNMSYTYDNDSRVTGITYKFNANTLGNLTYTYDSLGRRTQVGGSFAQTGLPGTVASATYDVANELTNWNGTPISYDLNGNMLSDGTNSFSWNARNQVATLNNVNLQYDGFGRRTKNLQNTSFVFDGANAVQELSGSTPTANLISGGIDEIFSRADASGAYTPLTDVLGSTIALVNANGNLVTQYAYDPFGNTIFSGVTSSNAFQYTGRENEGNGLFYYRARYYSPMLGRFINEDPLGFEGSGPNFYAYVFDNPTNLVDPFGLESGDLDKLVPGPNGETSRKPLAGRKDDGGFLPHVCSYGGFGYGGREWEGKIFGAEANAEAVIVVGYDSQEGGAHGTVWAGGVGLGEGRPGISGGIEVSRTWRDWKEHYEPIVFPADLSGHAPTIGGLHFGGYLQGGPLVQYADGHVIIGGYLGGAKGTYAGGGGGYVNLSWKPCGK
jgi:RHS repeat-associated protein